MNEQFKYITEEELEGLSPNGKILAAMGAAEEHGDKAEFDRLQRQVLYPAEALMTLKKTGGSHLIQEWGLRTDEADKKYGKDWLNK